MYYCWVLKNVLCGEVVQTPHCGSQCHSGGGLYACGLREFWASL